jgi:hypothetical protein
MTGTWRFRVVRDDCSATFIRRPESTGPFLGTIAEALQFAQRVQDYLGETASRVEAWSEGHTGEPEPQGCQLFRIVRHENKRDWRLLESRLTHPGWYRNLDHAIDYAAFRGRGYSCQIIVRDGLLLTIIVANGAGAITPIAPPGGRSITRTG